MNLLVGATGFVGGHVVEYLFQQNEISKGIFRKGAHLKIMDSNGVQGVEADLLDHHSLHEALEGVDTVYSMASPMPYGDSDYTINTDGLANLLEAALEAKAKCFVHLSTLDVYGFQRTRVGSDSEPRPENEYQRSKIQAEKVLLEFAKGNDSPRISIVRAARAVGSRDQSLVVPLLRMIDSGTVVLPSSGIMSFSHPKDVAQALFLAATRPEKSGSVRLIKSFDSEPAALASSLAEAVGKKVTVKKEGILSRSQLPDYTREQLRAHLVLESTKGGGDFGYSPKYDINATCVEIAEWCKKDPWAVESG